MNGREYADVLREAAGFFDKYPDFPVPETYRSVALLYEYPGVASDFVLQVVHSEGFIPDISKTGGAVIWQKNVGPAILCFVLPRKTTAKES